MRNTESLPDSTISAEHVQSARAAVLKTALTSVERMQVVSMLGLEDEYEAEDVAASINADTIYHVPFAALPTRGRPNVSIRPL